MDRYSAPADRWHGTAVLDGETPIAFTRGDSIDAPKKASLIAAALNSFTPEAVQQMRRQLAMVRVATERARDTMTVCSEIVPAEDIAGDCEAGAQDMVEAIFFIEKVLLALPQCIPAATVEEAAAIAARRARP